MSTCTVSKKNIFVLTGVSLISVGILFQRVFFRPEIISFLFLCLFITLLFLYKKQYTNLIFLLIPLEFLWVNLHIYFITGIILAVIFLCDELYTQKKTVLPFLRSQGVLPKKTITLILITASLMLVTIFNPNGIKGALDPFIVFHNFGLSVGELQSIFYHQSLYHDPFILFFEAEVLIYFLVLFINRKHTNFSEWLLGIIFSAIGISALRNIPLFTFTIFIPLIKHTDEICRGFFHFHSKKSQLFISLIGITFTGIFIAIFLYLLQETSQNNKDNTFLVEDMQNAGSFILNKHLPSPIFNNFEAGGYLGFLLYPHGRVFIDAWPDAYPASFFQNIYTPMELDDNVYLEIQRKYNFKTIVFSYSASSGFDSFLKNRINDSNWKLIYLNSNAIIFARNNTENASVIKYFAITPFNMQISTFDKSNLQALLRLAVIFNDFGWAQLEARTYLAMLKLNPNNCIALARLFALNGEQSIIGNYYLGKYIQACGSTLPN